MYHGKLTEELRWLYGEYKKIFDCYPDCYEGFDYGQKHYKQYVSDIKVALETGKELPDLYDEED